MKHFITTLFFSAVLTSFAQNIVPNTVFVKLKEEYAQYFNKNNRIQSNNTFSTIGLNKVVPMFPTNRNNERRKPTRIDRIYELKFEYDVYEAIELLKQEGVFEVVEPSPVFEVLYTPNDPLTTSGINQIKLHDFYAAWDIEKGDTNVVIGVVDNGFNFNHEDLEGNVKYNPFDPVDGINNEGDLFNSTKDLPLIDNYRGWDMADWDNDATGKHDHGTNVAGVAVAIGDNGKGITGTAYNCKFLPIKAAPDNNPTAITHGYHGLLYAAEQGCQVINLSFGSILTEDYFVIQNEIVNYAVFDLNSVVVAAAGNRGRQEYVYPASFENVLSVTSLANDTTKLTSATYNYHVDIIAAGSSLQTPSSTTGTDNYKHDSGSSLSTAVVSGAAALLRSKHPELSAMQVMQRLRVSGNVIDTMSKNIAYKDKIGRMLNPVAALTNDSIPALRTLSIKTDKSNNNISNEGDFVQLNLSITNYLAPSKNGKVTIEQIEGDFNLVDSTISLDDIPTLGTTTHEDNPFRIYVPASSQDSLMFLMKINYTADNGYVDHQYVNLKLFPTVISSQEATTISNENIQNVVYPNPFSNVIYLSLDEQLMNQSVDYVIHNTQHQKVFEAKGIVTDIHQQIDLSSSNLPKGVYILTIKNGSFTEHYKLIKD
ncbi:MAG: S8 family serine peptidase [Cytophagales bacterium]|nr:S8 family serine peptidase [Cytophagales bacterium]